MKTKNHYSKIPVAADLRRRASKHTQHFVRLVSSAAETVPGRVIGAATISAVICALATGCAGLSGDSEGVIKASFGQTREGTPVEIYTLRNSKGAEARIMTYGGTVVSLKMPDRNGSMADVVLGYDKLDGYLTNSPYFGALIGRYGNRIANGRFTLEGKGYTLTTNDGPNCLHGGVKGFDKVVWKAAHAGIGKEGPQLELTYLSPDGDQGFPGTVNVQAIYTLTDDNALRLEYKATTDKPTVVNLTHHSYFNLAGQGDILSHLVYIHASKFTPVDSLLIPTGELRPVEGTPFDFRTPTTIGARIQDNDEQLKFGKGYDHNWACDKQIGELSVLARVSEPGSGRVLEVSSTEPGLQFYSGNFLDGTIIGKGGRVYQHRNGFCMEPQHYPDSPNHPDFPSTELKPGQVFSNTIIYRFSTN